MSRGGEFAFTWATANPERVSSIYADNTGSNPEVFRRLGDLARNDVPLLLVCGSIDPWLNDQTRTAERRYRELGGQFVVIVKEGEGHYPLAPRDPKLVVDFIARSSLKGHPGLSKESEANGQRNGMLPPLVDLGPGQTYTRKQLPVNRKTR